MTLELEVTLRVGGKTLFGIAPIEERQFELLKKSDRWDLERYLRQVLVELGHGLTNQVYLHDNETVAETIKGEVELVKDEVPPPSSVEVTKLIESLPLLNGEAGNLIGNHDVTPEG